jgi:hypothetical protein
MSARTVVAATLPAIAAALVPKCPLCVIAIAGSIGLELPLNIPSPLPLMMLFVAISLTLILRAARRNDRVIGAVLACAAAALLIAQRVFAMPGVWGHAAVVLLVVSAMLTRNAKKECGRLRPHSADEPPPPLQTSVRH